MNVALITSTISPKPDVLALKVVDASERLSQYCASFSFYLGLLLEGVFDRIVYVDNSGYDLGALRSMAAEKGAAERVEFLSFRPQREGAGNNRLYLELEIVDHFFAQSRTLAAAGDCLVWKITGRYMIKNAGAIVRAAGRREPFDMIINHRNHPYKVVDFYFVGLNRKAFGLLFAANPEAYRGRKDGEITLREGLDALDAGSLKLVKRLPRVPLIQGVRGHDGSSYGKGKDFLKYLLRSAVDRIFPFLWI